MPETCYVSFVKALMAYFGNVSIAEMKELSVTDKLELSAMLNAEPEYTHPGYAAAGAY